MIKSTLIDIYNFDSIKHIENYLNKLQDEVNDIQNYMYEIRITLKNMEENMKEEMEENEN